MCLSDSKDFNELIGGQKKVMVHKIMKRDVIISSPPKSVKKGDRISKVKEPINLNMDMLSGHLSRNFSVNDDLGEFMNEEQ